MIEPRWLRRAAGLALPLCGPTKASGQQVVFKPLLDARIRFETFEQGEVPREAEALTVRVRPGVLAEVDGFSAIVEAEATQGIVNQFNDGFNGLTNHALIADGDNVEINRAQLGYRFATGTITVGRQILELADQRFIGSASFRQNQQTFDAARLQWTPIKGLTADVGYAWSVRTPTGWKGRGGRPQSIPGDNAFLLLGYATPIGTLTGFAYLIDQDAPAVQGYRLENQNYGVRLTGSRPVPGALRLSYALSYAWQRDHHRNPNRYSAHYYAGEFALAHRVLSGTVGYEVRGADDGRALTSFQTPDGSALRFQGWVGRFVTTPPDGVRDLYAKFDTKWVRRGPVSAIGIGVALHRFESDRLVRHYGNEADLLASARVGHLTLSAGFGQYVADRFASDAKRAWLSTEFRL